MKVDVENADVSAVTTVGLFNDGNGYSYCNYYTLFLI
jgi:hypothetical protein